MIYAFPYARTHCNLHKKKNVGSAWKDEDETSLEQYNIPKMFHENRYMNSKSEKGDTDTDTAARAHTHTHTHTHRHIHMHTAGNADCGWCPTA